MFAFIFIYLVSVIRRLNSWLHVVAVRLLGVPPGEAPGHGVQRDDVAGAEGGGGARHAHQARQPVLPRHHRAVRDQPAQLRHHARKHLYRDSTNIFKNL